MRSAETRAPGPGGPRARVVVGMGSNLGDRMAFLAAALEGMEGRGLAPEAISSVYETPPIGYAEQPPFLNLVVSGSWAGTPGGLLELLRGLEMEAGRERSFPNAPRTLDLDIIFFGSRFVREPEVTIPHPRWRGRSFVVHPLAEILPGFRDPETGWRIQEIADRWPLEPSDIVVVRGADALRIAPERGSP